MNWKDIFTSKKALEEEIKQLKESLNDCSVKLAEKQEHINTTNAYWKKKMRETKTSKPKGKKAGSDGDLDKL